MYLGRVIGTVVATRIYEGLAGSKLLLVTPLDHRLERTGDDQVAVDTVRAGTGDLVYLVGSREAALALDPWFVPVDAAIVGIVDQLAADGAAFPPPPEFHRHERRGGGA
jgi:ethanolamine utilization protein EutN